MVGTEANAKTVGVLLFANMDVYGTNANPVEVQVYVSMISNGSVARFVRLGNPPHPPPLLKIPNVDSLLYGI